MTSGGSGTRRYEQRGTRKALLDRPVWLHFLPLDTRRASGVATRLSNENQFALLRWLTLVSALIAKDFCIINVGTIEECDVAKSVLADALPLIERGLVRFSMRENDFLKHREKKEREYRGTSDWYGAFHNVEIYRTLNAVARIVPREFSIGDSIADRFADEDFFISAARRHDKRSVEHAAQSLSEAAARVRSDGLALTWPQLKKNLNDRSLPTSVGLPLTLTAYFDANRLKQRCCILGDVPFFEHADSVVHGVPTINLAKLAFAFRRSNVLHDVIRLTARGVCLLREREDFPAFRSTLLSEQHSSISRVLGGGQLLSWARSSLAIASTRTLETIREDNRRLADKIKTVLDHSNSEALDLVPEPRRHPLFGRIMSSLSSKLIDCDDYRGPTRRAFDKLIFHLLAFCRDRLDASPRERGKRGAYLMRPDATEWDLQSDLHEYLQGNYLEAEIRTEVDGIATGRVDILVSLGPTRFAIELKRARMRSQRNAGRFLRQASRYQATNARLALLGILDVTNRTGPPPHLEENFWVETVVPDGSSLPLFVVCFRVPGRLVRPSDMESARH